jgi:hypothetical protein
MTHPPPSASGEVYELTLAGGLGPVLRTAFRPWSTSVAHVCTVVRTEAPPDVDLVDLMTNLNAQGLEVEVITAA